MVITRSQVGGHDTIPSDPQVLIEDPEDPNASREEYDASHEEYIEGVTYSIDFERHLSAEDDISPTGTMLGHNSRVGGSAGDAVSQVSEAASFTSVSL